MQLGLWPAQTNCSAAACALRSAHAHAPVVAGGQLGHLGVLHAAQLDILTSDLWAHHHAARHYSMRHGAPLAADAQAARIAQLPHGRSALAAT